MLGEGGGLGCYPLQLPYATAEFVQYSVHNVSLFVIYRGVNPSVTDNYVFPVDFPDKKGLLYGPVYVVLHALRRWSEWPIIILRRVYVHCTQPEGPVPVATAFGRQ